MDNRENNFITQVVINENFSHIGKNTQDGKFGLKKIKVLRFKEVNMQSTWSIQSFVLEKGDDISEPIS